MKSNIEKLIEGEFFNEEVTQETKSNENEAMEGVDDEFKFTSYTIDISFIELAMLNSYLHSCYLKKQNGVNVNHYGDIDSIGRLIFRGGFNITGQYWFMCNSIDEYNNENIIIQTKTYVDASNYLIAKVHISSERGLIGLDYDKIYKSITTLAFNNSEFVGKCLKVIVKDGRFKAIKIIDIENISYEIVLNPTQKKYMEHFKNAIKRGSSIRYLLNGEPGTGKAQPLDAKILTPNGWTTMGDIKVGDNVLTPEGKVVNVIGVYPQGEKDIYKITFKDGRNTEACGEHLWKVYGIPKGKERKNSWSIMNTLDIKNKLNNTKYRLKLPLISENINIGEDIDFVVDPYLMGLLLGDGSFSDFHLKFSTSDDEIVESVNSLVGEKYNVIYDKNYDYLITRREGKGYRIGDNGNMLVREIKKIGLSDKRSDTKFIPNKYKNGSLKQKLDLLQGLMDSDGTVDKSSHLSYSTTSIVLAKDIQELIWSIGGICKISEKQTFYSVEKNGLKNVIKGKISYNLHIRYHSPKDLFRLKRKKELVSSKYQYSKTLKNNIDKIEFVGKKEAKCIMINDENHLYITDDYIVTHNTECIRDAIRNLTPNTTFIIPEFSSNEDLTTILEACEIFNNPVIIMDDIDLYLGSRENGSYTRILGQFLSFFDGVKKRKISLIGSTNDKGLVDKAAERPGRFNLTIDFGFLDDEQIIEVCKIHLPEKWCVNEVYECLRGKVGGVKANITGAFIANLAENIKEMSNDNPNWSLEETLSLITESYRGFYSSQVEKNKNTLGFKF